MQARTYESVVFDDGLPIQIRVYRLETYRLRWYSHPYLLFTAKGSVRLYLDGQTYELRERQMAWISSGALHSLDMLSPNNLLVELHIDAQIFPADFSLSDYTFDMPRFAGTQEMNPESFIQPVRMIASLVWHYNKRPKGYAHQIMSDLYSLASWLLRYDYFQPGKNKAVSDSQMQGRISRILGYMNEHYDEELSLKSVAEQEHLSYYYLSGSFTKVTGLTFREHLTQIRLSKSLNDLRGSRSSIDMIAAAYGFTSARQYARLFAQHFGTTPAAYREAYRRQRGDEAARPAESDVDYHLIYSLMDSEGASSSAVIGSNWHEECPVEADAGLPGTPVHPVWTGTATVARAANLLRGDVRQMVRLSREELGFTHLRFHGLFDDDMRICSRDADGTIRYNWLYLNQILDFLVGIGMHPFLELSYMPSALASGDSTVFLYRANITPPRSMEEWAALVRALLSHCVDRYGISEVRQWYVEVWSQPDYQDFFWKGTQQDYFELYRASAQAVRSVSPGIRVGGPGITSIDYPHTGWLEKFCRFCREEAVPLDFVSFHNYTETLEYKRRGSESFPEMPQSAMIVRDGELQRTQLYVETVRRILGEDIPCHITEWNISARHIFIVRDTCFMGTYMIRALLACRQYVETMAFWTLNDVLDEFSTPAEAFHGGMGLMTAQGIPKPSYYALRMLARLGDELVAEGENWILTRRGNAFQLLMYQLAYLDQLAQQATDFSSTYTGNIYALFEEKPAAHFSITLRNVSGHYHLTRYELNARHSSAYDAWLAMGAVAQPDAEQTEYLKASSVPRISTQEVQAEDGVLTLEAFVPVNGVQLIVLEK